MQIANVGASVQSMPMRQPERAEGARPDHDGDGDDKGSIKPATAAGVGTTVDVSA